MTNATLLRIHGSRGLDIAAVWQRCNSLDEVRPLVVVAPAYEHTIRNSFVIADYLLTQGFDVLRYDACNHLGRSDGSIEDFNLRSALTDLVDVVRLAQTKLPYRNISLVGTSLAGRVALHAAGHELNGQLACVASIACVVDVRATIQAVCGFDVFGRFLAGDMTGLDSVRVVDHDVKGHQFLRSALEDGWHTLASTIEDVQRAGGTPIFDVHGELDPWVATRDVLRVASSAPSAQIVVVRGAVHELNAATSRVALCELVRALVKHAQGRELPLTEIPEPAWHDIVARHKQERKWERSATEDWKSGLP